MLILDRRKRCRSAPKIFKLARNKLDALIKYQATRQKIWRNKREILKRPLGSGLPTRVTLCRKRILPFVSFWSASQPRLFLSRCIGLNGKAKMSNVREMFDFARQCYTESNRTLNPDDRERLRNKGDKYIQKGDELRRIEIIRGAFSSDETVR